MTVASALNRKTYAGDDVTTSFGTSPVVFFETSNLQVYVVNNTTGAETLLTENTDYTVSGGDGSTGTVNLAGGSDPHGALLDGTTLVILRVLPYTQTDDLVNNSISDAEVVEERFDRTTMMIQQLAEELDRVVKLSPAETGTDALTELPFDRAGQFLAFDASKNPIAAAGTTEVPVSAFMETLLDDTTAADGRTTLGAAASGAVTASGLTQATSRVLGRATASTGAIEELTLSQVLDLIGSAAQGDILYRGASAWARLPAGTNGQYLRTVGSGQNPSWADRLTLDSAQATTSGTAFDFTSIPAWVRRITVMFNEVSLSGTDNILVRIGDSGGVENTGYVSSSSTISNGPAVGTVSSVTGFIFAVAGSTRTLSGAMVLTHVGNNQWVASHSGKLTTATVCSGGGSKSISATLGRLTITRTGTDTFSAGSVNIMYE